jgi:hypothetical protein
MLTNYTVRPSSETRRTNPAQIKDVARTRRLGENKDMIVSCLWLFMNTIAVLVGK